MLVKICGMRDSNNIYDIAALKPDLMGFIFYPKSKRYVGVNFDPNKVKSVMPEISTVGVFVNEDYNNLIEIAKMFHFDFIQLHGNESPYYCSKVKDDGFKVLKAFGINSEFDWDKLMEYEQVCDYFLFDTNTQNYGGSGMKFDWNLLDNYKLTKPFILSGGISPDDVDIIKNNKCKQLTGIDINSQFEIEPALKHVEKIKTFLEILRH